MRDPLQHIRNTRNPMERTPTGMRKGYTELHRDKTFGFHCHCPLCREERIMLNQTQKNHGREILAAFLAKAEAATNPEKRAAWLKRADKTRKAFELHA